MCTIRLPPCLVGPGYSDGRCSPQRESESGHFSRRKVWAFHRHAHNRLELLGEHTRDQTAQERAGDEGEPLDVDGETHQSVHGGPCLVLGNTARASRHYRLVSCEEQQRGDNPAEDFGSGPDYRSQERPKDAWRRGMGCKGSKRAVEVQCIVVCIEDTLGLEEHGRDREGKRREEHQPAEDTVECSVAIAQIGRML